MEYLPVNENLKHPHLVSKEDRIKVAMKLAASVPLDSSFNGVYSIEGQNKRMEDPRMYNYALLLEERAERDELERKIKSLQEKLKNVSKELSQLKRNK